MAEPEIIITEEEFNDPQSLDAGKPQPEMDEEPEFELEEEVQEFEFEEDSALVEVPTVSHTSSDDLTFDADTLENLLTEPEAPEIEDISDSDTSDIESESVSSDIEEKSPDDETITTETQEDVQKTPNDSAPATGYSDDILSFPDNKKAPSSASSQEESSESEEKIDFAETIEVEHAPGILHTQQAQQIELSILERIDDLIHVLQNKSKANNNPEQMPHKQFATGIHYIKHEKNHYLGAKWLRKAAVQGHAKAQMYLGMLFVQGNGVPKSLFHAYAWFSLAVCQDIAEAKDARKKLEPHLTAKEINASLKYAADLLDRIQL